MEQPTTLLVSAIVAELEDEPVSKPSAKVSQATVLSDARLYGQEDGPAFGYSGKDAEAPWRAGVQQGGGPRVVVSTAAFHARVRGSVPGLGGLKEAKIVSSPSTCES